MATKVLDLDIANIFQPITGLENYQQALLLFRHHGRPVAQVVLPVINDSLSLTALNDCLHKIEFSPLCEPKLYDDLDWDENDQDSIQLPHATVAVCTRDRPQELKRCLDACMALRDIGQEFLVVDYCPSDDSSQQVSSNYSDRVRYVCEYRPGLNNARNRALRETRHEIIVFNDDDAVPDAHWLDALVRNFAAPVAPGIAAPDLTPTTSASVLPHPFNETLSDTGLPEKTVLAANYGAEGPPIRRQIRVARYANQST